MDSAGQICIVLDQCYGKYYIFCGQHQTMKPHFITTMDNLFNVKAKRDGEPAMQRMKQM